MSTEKECDAISKEQLDSFTGDVLHGCLMLLDLSADSVYRICDVIVTVARRNGIEWQRQTLMGLIEKVCNRIRFIHSQCAYMVVACMEALTIFNFNRRVVKLMKSYNRRLQTIAKEMHLYQKV